MDTGYLLESGAKYRYSDCPNITSMGVWMWTTYWDLVQFNVASTLVCVFHEFLCMLVLFERGVFEELGYSVEGDVMASEEVGLGWGESRGKLLLPFRQFWWNLFRKSTFGDIFEGEMLIRTQPTTLLQIFCKIVFNSKAIVERMSAPDDNFWRNS